MKIVNKILLLIIITISLLNTFGCEQIKEKVQEAKAERLISRLDDDSNYKNVIKDLKKIGKPAILPLIDNLKDENYSAEALIAIGKPAVKELIKSLHNKSKCSPAAFALGKIERKNIYSRAVDPLIKALSSSNNLNCWENTSRALGEIGNKKAIKPLVNTFDEIDEFVTYDNDFNCKKIIAESLNKIGYSTFTRLFVFIKDDDEDAKLIISNIIKENHYNQAIPILITLLKDEAKSVRTTAASSLANLSSVGEKSLVTYLNKKGTVDLIKEYLNSNDDKLENIAQNWANEHDYTTFSVPENSPLWKP